VIRRRRTLVALGALAVLTLTAGCLGTGPVSEEQLAGEPPLGEYDFDANVTAHLELTEGAQVQAVYDTSAFEGNSIELYRNDGFGGRNPIPVRNLRYRYPNGTVIDGAEFLARGGTVDRNRNIVNVTLPAGAREGGKLAFTTSSTPKRFSLPVFVSGSYEVVLPPNRDVSVPVFGSVSPGATSVTTPSDDGRVHIRWDNLDGRNLAVQFYLERDLAIFGGLVALVVVIGAGGLYRYRRQIERLQQEREELGLDVDTDDDDLDGGPPPGMR
jgi:hypothetical protein